MTIQNTSQVQSNIDDAPAGFGSSGQLILLENTTFTNAFHAIALGASFAGPSVYTNITITDPLEGALGLSHCATRPALISAGAPADCSTM